jgi:hypothetical protein
VYIWCYKYGVRSMSYTLTISCLSNLSKSFFSLMAHDIAMVLSLSLERGVGGVGDSRSQEVRARLVLPGKREGGLGRGVTGRRAGAG